LFLTHSSRSLQNDSNLLHGAKVSQKNSPITLSNSADNQREREREREREINKARPEYELVGK